MADEGRARPTDERTPLLAKAAGTDADGSGLSSGSSTVVGIGSTAGEVAYGHALSPDTLEDADEAADDEQDEVAAATATSTGRIVLILGTAYVGVFVGAADASVIATLSAPIASAFQSLSLLSWVAAAYLVANAACQPVSGRVTDVIGRGPGLVFSNLLFAAGNLMCGLAGDAGTLLVGRAVAGIGGGGLMSISTFLASDLVPLRRRGVVQGIGNIAYSAGAMLGGVLGGLSEQVWTDRSYGGWRLAFYAQVPVSLVSAVLVAVLVRVPPHKSITESAESADESSTAALRRIDFPGAGLLVTFLVLLLLGLNAGGNVVPWTHLLVLVALPLALAAFAGFVVWEAQYARHPIIPVRLVVRRTVLSACLANLVCTAAMMMAIFYVPLYLQVRGFTAADAGVRLLFSSLGVAVSSVGSGLIMKRTGRYVGLGITSLSLFVVGFVIAAFGGLAAADSPAWPAFVALFLIGGSYGAMLTITLLACIAAVSQSRQAVITSATYAFRSVGATLGLTVASAVYQNILRARLWLRLGHLPDAADEIARICDDLAELHRLPPGWHDPVIQSFMDAFRGVWLTGLVLALVGLVCVSLMKQHTLHATLERP
ncbi:major facilitator superfamily transporter multidrug resistance [Grosmannia clavigera kw1407]|uniref:Major facilitator superfamily transporter multidrug resistance n=1 Tax=Grosmannia clavigera (strain kw1407 / UAMH 11150) TaxID=655863 RepID=F0XIL2_GROCL|nr:major facilitator superfamily transporter multidrug resistance [Grosmannia clavigera kw1407]EFX02510.1 major facilitator superfamily transporter multidrug resistance [Grosmannia clavigera kw1407]